MAIFFDRKAELFLVSDKERREFDGLRTKFQFDKVLSTSPNRGTISVYNLNKNSRSFLEETNTAGLNAGYRDLSQAFSGDVSEFSIEKTKDGDFISTIEIVDGIIINQAETNETFEPGASVKTMFETMVRDLGQNPTEVFKSFLGFGDLSDEKTNNGKTISGRTIDETVELGRAYGIEFFTDDNILRAIEADGFLIEPVVVLSKDSGLIGSPQKTKDGIKLKSLMNVLIAPGKKIEILSEEIAGLAVVERVTHLGDTNENDWFSDIECRLIPEG